SFEMVAQWHFEHLVGYMRSWSATQRFIAANERDPLTEIDDNLRDAWGDAEQTRKVVWPLILRVGVNEMPEPPKERHAVTLNRESVTTLNWKQALFALGGG